MKITLNAFITFILFQSISNNHDSQILYDEFSFDLLNHLNADDWDWDQYDIISNNDKQTQNPFNHGQMLIEGFDHFDDDLYFYDDLYETHNECAHRIPVMFMAIDIGSQKMGPNSLFSSVGGIPNANQVEREKDTICVDVFECKKFEEECISDAYLMDDNKDSESEGCGDYVHYFENEHADLSKCSLAILDLHHKPCVDHDNKDYEDHDSAYDESVCVGWIIYVMVSIYLIYFMNIKRSHCFILMHICGYIGTNAFAPAPFTFSPGTSTLPTHLQAEGVCGTYYANSKNVYFFGGYTKYRMITRYNIDEDIFYSLPDAPVDFWCSGQAITLIYDVIYLTKLSSNVLVTYNITSNQFNSSFATIPSYTDARYPCFANIDDRYLSIIGDHTSSGYPKAFRIFDLIQGIWSFGPDTPMDMVGGACTVHNHYLYAMGTVSDTSVIKIDVTHITNIANYNWTTLNGSLNLYTLHASGRIALHFDENIIYFVGQYYGIIDAVDTTSDIIYGNVATTIDGAWLAPAIIANNNLLLFGGVKDGCCSSMSTIWQIHSLQTSSPTAAPSTAPTVPPTASPISSCIDYKQQSNDGNNETVVNIDILLNKNNYQMDTNALKFETSDTNDYAELTIECATYDCFIKCNGTSSCFQTKVQIRNIRNKSIAIFCEKQHSCGSSTVYTTTMVSLLNVSIVCVDKYSCLSMQIHLNNFSSFNLYCLNFAACQDINVSVEIANGNMDGNDGIIHCIALNGCDNLVITTNSNQTQLVMYQHSEDVTLDNGVGFLYDNSNVWCNIGRYIRIESNESLTTDYLANAVQKEYDNMLPCSDVTVICGEFSCSMTYLYRTLTGLIPPNSGCYWVNVQEIQNIICEGECISSPTPPPTSFPTKIPTTPTNIPSDAPTSAPTTTPSSTPSLSPTDSPTSSPSTAPTLSPTVSPTSNPSINPTSLPTGNPTSIPSVAPTSPPSSSPTIAPSIAPSTQPTASPTKAPSQSPTRSPTRLPTGDIEEIYHSFIDVMFVIEGLNLLYIEMLEDNTLDVIPHIIESIEYGYFVENAVEYHDFTIQINDINGFQDLTNINLKEGENVKLNSKILCGSVVSGLLLEKSKTDEFTNEVTTDLKQYFTNNDNLEFYIENNELLKVYSDETVEEQSEFGIIIFSISIVVAGALASVYVKWSNKRENATRDNAQWMAPLLFSLQIYDFISDINLSYDILSNYDSRATVIFWCGIFSAVFTAVPFISNLLYGIRIKKQNVITTNRRADEYFTANMAKFLALIILSGGCYPALLMVSSGIFGLNMLQSGLTKHDLNQLSKIKIKSTITMENGPQLIVQIIYATQSSSLSTAVFLAFVGSFLSVIMAVSSYYANKENRKNEEIMAYYVKFYNKNAIKLDDDEEENIKMKKGRTNELQKSMAREFGISDDNIEIGYIWTRKDGVEMYICHYLSKSELSKHNKSDHGYMSMITPKQYLRTIYKQKRREIAKVFQQHFEIDNNQFIVELIIDHETDNTSTDNVCDESDRTQLIPGLGNEERLAESIPTIKSMQVEMYEMKQLMQSIVQQMNIVDDSQEN